MSCLNLPAVKEGDLQSHGYLLVLVIVDLLRHGIIHCGI